MCSKKKGVRLISSRFVQVARASEAPPFIGPRLEFDPSVALHNRVLEKVPVVALRRVVAIVRTAALGARKRGIQNGARDAAHRLRFRQPPASLPFLNKPLDAGAAFCERR